MTQKSVKKPKRFKKYALSSARFLLQLCLGIIVIIIITFFALYARILWKPIDLGFLHPLFEKIISDNRFDVHIENSQMVHDYKVGLFGVHIDEVKITNKISNDTYILNDIILDISKTSLLKQKLGINSVAINSVTLPPIAFEHKETGNFNIRKIFDDTFKLPMLSPFQTLEIEQIHGLFYIPTDNSNTKTIPLDITTTALSFKRRLHYLNDSATYSLEYNFVVNNNPLGKIRIDTGHIGVVYETDNQSVDMTLKQFKTNRGNIPFANAHINLDNGHFKINSVLENIYDGDFYKNPIGLQSVALQGHFNHHNQFLNIQDYELAFEKFLSIKGNANVDLKKGFDDFSYNLNANIEHLTLPYLKKLWSEKMASGAREWVKNNLTAALFDTSHIEISGKASDDYPKISINAPISAASFSYLKPMKPATNVKGRLLLKDKTFTAQVDSGMIDVLNVKQARFEIADILIPIPIGKVQSHITGALKPLLTLIDTKPLNLMSKGGFGYKNTVGNFDGTITMKMALLKDVKLSDIQLTSDVTLKDGALQVGKKQLPLERINATLHLTPDTAKGSGTVALFGIRNQFKWHENFNIRSDVTTDLHLKIPVINEQQIDKLVTKLSGHTINIPDYTQGNANLNTHLQLQNGRIKLLDIQGDVSDMYFGYGDNLWHFAKNTPKSLAIIATETDTEFQFKKINLTNRKNIIQLSDMVIDNTGIKSTQIDLINFKNIIRGLSGHYHTVDNRHFAKLNASKLFLQPIRDDMFKKDEKNTKITRYPNILTSLTVKHFQKSDDLVIDNAHIIASRDIDNPHLLYLDIESSMIEMTKVKIHETGIDTRTIDIKTQNAGRLFAGMGIFDDLQNGNLTMNLTQNANITKGKINIRNGTILKSPLMAKLLSLASLTGILDRLNSRGLSVDKTTLDLKKIDDILYFTNGSIHGSAIGISFQGQHHLETKILNIYGTLIPFYGLNSILSEIPILGELTSSRTTEGLVGMSYKIDGRSDNPKISVNPLSILTLGILRRIFEN